ncbi:MAG: DUF89 family protein [Deltaproteobacteria bacterium]|nr:DUF89 family protein [Deltaproteobacteria bacterium]
MNTYLDCLPCILRQGLEAARHTTADARIHEQLMRDLLRLTAELDLDRPPPFMGQLIHRWLRRMSGSDDPYREAKSRYNQLALAVLPELSAVVEQATDPLLAAAKFAVAANAIDLGVSGTLVESEVLAALRAAAQQPLLGDWQEFRAALEGAADILYLADNAGEIAVDRLLIEQLGPTRVTLATRGGAVVNDATQADAREAGLHRLVAVIDNGSDAPGTILADCSDEFRQRFESAGLIIAKGQGNYETLSDVAGNLFFLFKVKCPVVSRQVELPIGSHALKRPQRGQPRRREPRPGG